MAEHRFNLDIGPFSFTVTTDSDRVAEDVTRIYSPFPTPPARDFVDFDVAVRTRSPLRRLIRPQIDFFLNERRPFKPLPRVQGYPMLEWGMNWCIASSAHQYLIIHAGVVEKNGVALVMPATQGAGKSTLTAALVYGGWRLFSDELALVSLADGQVYPCPRPINLKNESIAIIRERIGGGVFSRTAHDTHKGTVALLQPTPQSVASMRVPAVPRALVFPRFEAGSGMRLERMERPAAFEEIIGHCFNYHLLGLHAFERLHGTLSACDCYRLTYSDFDQADRALSALVV